MLRCGLLGRTLGHSYSPAIHRHFGDYTYQLYEQEPEALEAFLTAGAFDGLNVTIPYKKAVIPYCAALSETARAIGSVNTLVRRPDGSLYGDNTDAYGFACMVQRCSVPVDGKKALVFGSGGASATVCAVLRQMGAQPVVISRSGPDNYENLSRHRDAQVLVNATPVGMYPHAGKSPVQVAAFPRCAAVLDVIYNPARTALLLQAEALGIPACNGLCMLVAQARRSAELFLGRPVPEAAMEEAERAVRGSMENLILIGMPGCGKSTVGRALAQQSGRTFVDTDEWVARQAGMSIPDYFAAHGEAAFRALETKVLEELGQRSGLVIATGGGCVTRPENEPLLRQNGTIIWLERPLEQLPVHGRPLSQKNSVQALYAAREPLYRQFSMCRAENNAAPEQVAVRILEQVIGGTQ